METIFIAKSSRGASHFRLGRLGTRLVIVAVVVVCVSSFVAGLHLRTPRPPDPRPDLYAAAVKRAIEDQRLEVVSATGDARRHLDALALRLGELQARIARLDALGARLVDVADLDPEEFGFGTAPPRGGATGPSPAYTLHRVPDFLGDLESLEATLRERALSLGIVDTALTGRRIDDEVRPAGRPVSGGWISSGFGWRNDPITGKRMFHYGVDFAGRSGSEIVAVASGVVAAAGHRPGFGNFVKIHHGDGLSTLYAHNRKNLVTVGQTVKKGDVVALMGATGRATGSHTHFEVQKDGKSINPIEFIRSGVGSG